MGAETGSPPRTAWVTLCELFRQPERAKARRWHLKFPYGLTGQHGCRTRSSECTALVETSRPQILKEPPDGRIVRLGRSLAHRPGRGAQGRGSKPVVIVNKPGRPSTPKRGIGPVLRHLRASVAQKPGPGVLAHGGATSSQRALRTSPTRAVMPRLSMLSSSGIRYLRGRSPKRALAR